jgi:hypothetical protein
MDPAAIQLSQAQRADNPFVVFYTIYSAAD